MVHGCRVPFLHRAKTDCFSVLPCFAALPFGSEAKGRLRRSANFPSLFLPIECAKISLFERPLGRLENWSVNHPLVARTRGGPGRGRPQKRMNQKEARKETLPPQILRYPFHVFLKP